MSKIKKADLLQLVQEQADMMVELSGMVKMNKLSIIKLENEREQPEPQLKQLDQSVFDGLDEKWRFAARCLSGKAIVTKCEPKIILNGYYCEDGYLLVGTGYDTSNWQNSLIERDTAKELLEVDLSSELTGSELVRAMLERGDRWVMCMVANNEANMFLATKPVIVHHCNDSGFISVSGCYSFAAAVNNQGEPLTAAEAGL